MRSSFLAKLIGSLGGDWRFQGSASLYLSVGYVSENTADIKRTNTFFKSLFKEKRVGGGGSVKTLKTFIICDLVYFVISGKKRTFAPINGKIYYT